jgi:hypothetical protein
MTTAPHISTGELAQQLAILQPRAIAGLLLEDSKFRAEFGLPITGAISYGGGPAILKTALFERIRNLLRDGQPQSLPALNGKELRAEQKDEYVLISFTAEDGATVEIGSVILLLLSPDRETRRAAFDRVLADLDPTGPINSQYWRQQLEIGPLDDEKLEQLLDQCDDSVVPHFARIQQDITTGLLDKHHLIPTSVSYWERLCGPRPDRMDQEQWLKETFQSHRRDLLDRSLARGLDLCLAMNLRDDLSPHALTEHISNDDLFTALQQIEPIDDPFSLLGVVDIAVSRAPTDQRFAERATQTIERLCGDTLPRQTDGVDVYSFLPALIDFAVGALQLTPTICSQPAYWRRLCAWTQAGLMVRAFRAITFDPTVLTEYLQRFRFRETSTAALLDLQECPQWRPSEASSLRIRAEVLGRLKLLRHREETAGRQLPGLAALDEALQAFAEYAPLFTDMPGPLETHRAPAISMRDMDTRQVTELRQLADELTPDPAANPDEDNWFRFSHLSQIIRFDEHIISRMTELVPKTSFGVTANSFLSSVKHLISISYIAVSQRHFPLAEAILARARQEIQKSNNETQTFALVELGLIAVAASPDKATALDHLATYFTSLAYHLPQGTPSRALFQEIEDLKTLTPAGEWKRFSRAEALAALGS